jgi:SAM-dependent methyltransferase
VDLQIAGDSFPLGPPRGGETEAVVMRKTMNCRICGAELTARDSTEVREAGTGCYGSPHVQLEKRRTDIFYCDACNHMQFPFLLSERVYDAYEYDNDYRVSRYVLDIYHRQMKTLAERVPDRRILEDGLFVDIGCGAGNALTAAGDYFSNVLGIEPSDQFAKELERKGIPYLHTYFSEEIMKSLGKKIDVFYSSQVFEHLEAPLEVLRDVFRACSEGAYGMVEVPDGQRVWERKEFSYLNLEHVNNYSPLSLSRLACKAGFLVEYCNVHDGKNIEILMRKPRFKPSFSACLENTISTIRAFPADAVVSVWGAGEKALSILPLFEKYARIHAIYDNDPSKHGRYIPDCKTPICRPSPEDVRQNDIIVLQGTKYDRDIQKDLEEKYRFRGRIITLEC